MFKYIKENKTNILVLIVLGIVVYFIYSSNRALRKELKISNDNIEVMNERIHGVTKKVDDMGNEFNLFRSSVFSKKDFEIFEKDLSAKFASMGYKTKDIVKAAISGLETKITFTPKDTFLIINNIDTLGAQYYRDPKNWFEVFIIEDSLMNIAMTDTIYYGTVKERKLRKNGKQYWWPIRWLVGKENKEVFQSLNPYTNVKFSKAATIKK